MSDAIPEEAIAAYLAKLMAEQPIQLYSRVQKWEHLIIRHPKEEDYNILGEGGWELATVTAETWDQAPTRYIAYFKRPLP